jgi:hypothetical protein
VVKIAMNSVSSANTPTNLASGAILPETDKHFNRLKASIAPLIGHQPT